MWNDVACSPMLHDGMLDALGRASCLGLGARVNAAGAFCFLEHGRASRRSLPRAFGQSLEECSDVCPRTMRLRGARS
jgi:hypothetical protein